MGRFERASRALVVALVCGVGAASCRDSGLPDRNLPLEEARQREYAYAAYQPSPQNVPLILMDRQYIGALPVESVPDRMLTAIGAVGGTGLWAVRGHEPPYSRLYSRVGPDRWRPYVPLH